MIYCLGGWEKIKKIPEDRYFVENNMIGERLNIYQNNLFEKEELYYIDKKHTKVVELGKKIAMHPLTYETIIYPYVEMFDLKK